MDKGWEKIPHRAMADTRINAGAFRTLCIIAWKTVDHFGTCKLSYKALGAITHTKVDTIMAHVKKLEETGWIEVKRGGLNEVNTYKVNFNNLLPGETEDTTEDETPQTEVPKEKIHKPIKLRKNTDYSQDRVDYFKQVKLYANSLEISKAWREEILAWVNRVLDTYTIEELEMSPQELFRQGTKKFADSDLRWQED